MAGSHNDSQANYIIHQVISAIVTGGKQAPRETGSKIMMYFTIILLLADLNKDLKCFVSTERVSSFQQVLIHGSWSFPCLWKLAGENVKGVPQYMHEENNVLFLLANANNPAYTFIFLLRLGMKKQSKFSDEVPLTSISLHQRWSWPIVLCHFLTGSKRM